MGRGDSVIPKGCYQETHQLDSTPHAQRAAEPRDYLILELLEEETAESKKEVPVFIKFPRQRYLVLSRTGEGLSALWLFLSIPQIY